jgi:hypothetical protein
MPVNTVTTGKKKNLGGGKAFKKQGSKDRRGERQNNEICSAFVDDVLSGEIATDVVVARMTKAFGGGRYQLITPDNKTHTAISRGSLTVSAGAARAPGNVLAITNGSYVLLQINEYGSQIAAVMTRQQVHAIKDKIPATPGFFSGSEAVQDEGFDWDLEEGESAPAPAAAASSAAAAAELDIDAI